MQGVTMRPLDPSTVEILMLRKRIDRARLKKKFRVKDSAISMALRGERKTLLDRIYRYVKAA
jgi:hypothetical protein